MDTNNKNTYIANQNDFDELRYLTLQHFTPNSAGNLPNVILSGPPACGKTQAIDFFVKEILRYPDNKYQTQIASSDDQTLNYFGFLTLKDGNTKITRFYRSTIIF